MEYTGKDIRLDNIKINKSDVSKAFQSGIHFSSLQQTVVEVKDTKRGLLTHRFFYKSQIPAVRSNSTNAAL